MYRNTAYNRMTTNAGAPRWVTRFKNLLLLFLLVAVILLAVFGGRAMMYRNDANHLFISKIQLECGNALTLTNSLSRTAGASSSATLGRIRSHVYAMETINSLSVGLEGASGWLISEDWFTTLYGVLEEYSQKLITGMTTGDQQTALMNALQTLYDQLDTIQ
ncbi:MAG: hypothetical protein IKK21_04375 [Clostridia bacterium]|nr:hypothetical protein [Clostridia bacterium]